MGITKQYYKTDKSTLLVVDSGGSKANWCWVDAKDTKRCVTTRGFNPYTQPISDLEHIIVQELPHDGKAHQKKIFFYGTGLSANSNREKIRAALQCTWPQSHIEVHSDLLGAARALCGNASGIVCILGTGSNCGWYDGQLMQCKTRSLGWALGDEGAGSYLGKRLIRDYLQGNMPSKIAEALHEKYPWDTNKFLQHIYRGSHQAAFLGSFSPFIAAHIEDEYCRQLVYSGFEHFCRNNIIAYDNYPSTKAYFTGSVAYHYADLLKQVAQKMGIGMGNIIKAPIDKLTAYHQQSVFG